MHAVTNLYALEDVLAIHFEYLAIIKICCIVIFYRL